MGRSDRRRPPTIPVAPFTWHDGDRVVLFGRGRLAEAGRLLAPGYILLTTPRAREAAPEMAAHAAAVREVPPGRVDELAAALREGVRGDTLVALGGGRVIDVAKALAAADPPRTVAAIPTTLSGAEMTGGHRHAAGVPAETTRVRPAIVINDPALSASQPPEQLAQSAANALGHAVEGPLTPRTNPVAMLSALHAARLIAWAYANALDERSRDALALAALLAGYVIDSTGYGLHHIVSQTLARFAGVGHGAANALMLPQSVPALAARGGQAFLAALEGALGTDPVTFASELRDRTRVSRLRDAGVSEDDLDRCAEEASRRPDLAGTPPAPDVDELRALYRRAW